MSKPVDIFPLALPNDALLYCLIKKTQCPSSLPSFLQINLGCRYH